MSKVKVVQSCPALCDPMDSTVHGILQTRILERVAFSFSRGSSQHRNRIQISHIAGRFFTNWATREAQVQNPVLSFTTGWTGENYLHSAGLQKKILIVILSKSFCKGLNRTHSSTLAWKIPWTEEHGRLQSMGSQSQTRLSNFTFTFIMSQVLCRVSCHLVIAQYMVLLAGKGNTG